MDLPTALFQALGAAFDLVQTALQPGIIAAQAYFEQLINAKPVLQDPFAPVREHRQNSETLLIYVGLGLAVLLIFAIVFKKRS